MVHDFRGMDEQAISIFIAENNGKVCGMFEADRIRISPPLPKWRKWLSAAMMAMGFTGLYHTAFAQQPARVKAPETKAVTENTDATFGIALETNAEFPGGVEAFRKFISRNIVPDATCQPGEKAFFTFMVERDGTLSDIRIIRSPFSAEMNKQIISALEKSPRWKPGIQNGRVLRQQYTLPVVPVPINNAITK
jgi:protein TonB